MFNPIDTCEACGKTITAEEVTAGLSLACTSCDDSPLTQKSKDDIEHDIDDDDDD